MATLTKNEVAIFNISFRNNRIISMESCMWGIIILSLYIAMRTTNAYNYYLEYGLEQTESYIPSSYEWSDVSARGSITELADIDWAIENAPYFVVATPEQLAGVVYYVNELGSVYDEYQIELAADIDLDGYDWVPMGCMGDMNKSFNGEVNGNGYAIRNMSISIPYTNHCAFIGYSVGSYVHDIRFENAYINGGQYTGIIGGEIYMSKVWENIYVSGVIENASDEKGSIIGREAGTSFFNCSADVTYVDKDGTTYPIEYFSHRQEVIANTPVDENFVLTLNQDGSITRTSPDNEGEYINLCWHVESNGVEILSRLAENELILDASYGGDTIWLEAFTGETYTRVSNIIER